MPDDVAALVEFLRSRYPWRAAERSLPPQPWTPDLLPWPLGIRVDGETSDRSSIRLMVEDERIRLPPQGQGPVSDRQAACRSQSARRGAYMSDIKLFRIGTGTVDELTGTT